MTTEQRIDALRRAIDVIEAIAAIEAEAVNAALDALAAKVKGLEPCCDDAAVVLSDSRILRAMCQHGAYVESAVLALIAEARR